MGIGLLLQSSSTGSFPTAAHSCPLYVLCITKVLLWFGNSLSLFCCDFALFANAIEWQTIVNI